MFHTGMGPPTQAPGTNPISRGNSSRASLRVSMIALQGYLVALEGSAVEPFYVIFKCLFKTTATRQNARNTSFLEQKSRSVYF